MVKNSIALALLVAGFGPCRQTPTGPAPLQGVIEFDERVLAFDVGGRIVTSGLVRGESIHTGATIATLDDSLDRPQRAARLADLESTQAQLALLRAGSRREDVRSAEAQLDSTRDSEQLLSQTYARQEALAAQGAVPSASLDELRNQLVQVRGQRAMLIQRLSVLRHGARSEEIDAAEARVDASRAAINALDTRLQHYTLHAPMDATVLDIHSEPGEVVAPGTPVATIGDTDHPFVDVFVAQGHMNEVRLGGAASVRIDASRTPFPGRVEHIAEQTEFTPRFLFSERERPNLVVRVRIRIDDPEHRAHAGLPAFVTLAPVPQ